MREFLRIASGVNVLPVCLELQRAGHLWDDYPLRRTFPGTAHGQMTDIFVRFRPRADITGPLSHNEEYRCEFWPAWRLLPSLRPLVLGPNGLMAMVAAVELGSILITRLPPGGTILPHSDKGAWSPEFYNCKAHLTLCGSSISRCENEEVAMSTGDVWTFDNLKVHSVENNGLVDRIVCIVSMRVDC